MDVPPTDSQVLRVAIDTGGTFTDCHALAPDGSIHRAKVLSSGHLRTAVVEVLGPERVRIADDWASSDAFLVGFANTAGQLVTAWDARERILEFDRPFPRPPRPGELLDLTTGEEVPLPSGIGAWAPEQVAIRVTNVEAGTGSDRAGLRSGDILLAFGGDPFFSERADVADLHRWLVRELRSYPQDYELLVWREGRAVALRGAFALGPYMMPTG